MGWERRQEHMQEAAAVRIQANLRRHQAIVQAKMLRRQLYGIDDDQLWCTAADGPYPWDWVMGSTLGTESFCGSVAEDQLTCASVYDVYDVDQFSVLDDESPGDSSPDIASQEDDSVPTCSPAGGRWWADYRPDESIPVPPFMVA
eukprot:NODE_1100_length_675_cov_584.674121_g859_i0.p1 GENE.NODE_1100_length_675_cov_584.674121_g859_i0~~NODE_1100_length_675_cov_584.674121_g859_i0.p1  ORF type:complete len:145 (-),score=22.19 NODE_1100_length_675_cov_584.674121_g859_i0:212-646(-)